MPYLIFEYLDAVPLQFHLESTSIVSGIDGIVHFVLFPYLESSSSPYGNRPCGIRREDSAGFVLARNELASL